MKLRRPGPVSEEPATQPAPSWGPQHDDVANPQPAQNLPVTSTGQAILLPLKPDQISGLPANIPPEGVLVGAEDDVIIRFPHPESETTIVQVTIPAGSDVVVGVINGQPVVGGITPPQGDIVEIEIVVQQV